MSNRHNFSESPVVHLTPHFALSELIESDYAERHDLDNTPNSPVVMANLYRLAMMLEEVRTACDSKPVIVTSGYRSPEVNRGVGGSPRSDHMIGEAADIKVPGFGNPQRVVKRILESGIKFGQIIFEGSWVHISLPDGTRDGEVLAAKFVRQADGSVKTSYYHWRP